MIALKIVIVEKPHWNFRSKDVSAKIKVSLRLVSKLFLCFLFFFFFLLHTCQPFAVEFPLFHLGYGKSTEINLDGRFAYTASSLPKTINRACHNPLVMPLLYTYIYIYTIYPPWLASASAMWVHAHWKTFFIILVEATRKPPTPRFYKIHRSSATIGQPLESPGANFTRFILTSHSALFIYLWNRGRYPALGHLVFFF